MGQTGRPLFKHMARRPTITTSPFTFGHICGTYDKTEQGVWELYLSSHNSPDGSMAPGVHFLGAEPGQELMNLHPWTRPGGLVTSTADAGINDTEWRHVAWQYEAGGGSSSTVSGRGC